MNLPAKYLNLLIQIKGMIKPHNLYEVILKSRTGKDLFYHYYAYTEQAVFNEIKRLYPSKPAEEILISVVEYGYDTIYQNHREHRRLDD